VLRLVAVTTRIGLLALLLLAAWTGSAWADKKTVCSITVGSADEKESFRRHLPEDQYAFVELVERGRSDWLASACKKGVRCDALLVSGHFDDGSEFYSGRLDARESLPVDELQRASCSASCPALFSQLKEVYLFGCNTLDAGARRSASGEIGRSLVRAGYTPVDAERASLALNERYGESNRDRMRQIFPGVPVIYGFSSKAPLGAAAGPMLERYFQSNAGSEIGSGRVNPKLVSLFAASSMTTASGLGAAEPQAQFRSDVCRLADDRSPAAQKLDFVHHFLQREMAEVRMFLDHLEAYVAALGEAERQTPSVAKVLAEIARDEPARAQYLAFARDADSPAVRARMLSLARNLGWLSAAEERAEQTRMIAELIAKDGVGAAEVSLVCALNEDGALSRDRDRLSVSAAQAGKPRNAAVLACLGDAESHARMLRALASTNDDDVALAQVYLHHRPIEDAMELRSIAASITRMQGSEAQVRALDALARYSLSDRESLEELARAFVVAKSVAVQRAIAGVLVRADYGAIASAELVRSLREHRVKSRDGEDLIDVLIRRLQNAVERPKQGA
jgi:hypothetical protein